MAFFKWLFGYLLAWATVWQPSASQTPEEGFNNFLYHSMQNYHDWAIDNGFEPLRVAESLNWTEQRLTIRYTCDMRNHLIHGLSKVDPAEWLEIHSNLTRGFFRVIYDTHPKIFVKGEYTVEGSVDSTIPITGFGYFNNSNNDIRAGVPYVWFSNFSIVDDHIDLSEAGMRVSDIYWWPRREWPLVALDLQFDGLEAGGYEADVDYYIEINYDDRTKWLKAVNAANIRKYFEDLFKETPVSEIIGTTAPPGLTEGPQRTTKSLPAPT